MKSNRCEIEFEAHLICIERAYCIDSGTQTEALAE